VKLTEREFDEIVNRAIGKMPKEIRQYLGNVLISVKKRPTKAKLLEMGLPEDEPLLGLYDGVPLLGRSVTSPPLFPDTITLFQEPLEDMCDTVEELEEQIEITVVHEIAHFFGMDEARLAELGYE
jgi:predicted Zn-dependent protease with MMP-like domain